MYQTQTFLPTQIYYIIYYLSPTHVPLSISLEINHTKKKITAEKLLGIICGSVAALFAIIAIVIFIIRRNQFHEISSVPESSSSFNEETQNDSIRETKISILDVDTKDIDQWF